MSENTSISRRGLNKFLIATSLLIAILFIPVKIGSFGSLYTVFAGELSDFLLPVLKYLVFIFVSLIFLLTFITSVFKPRILTENLELNNLFNKNLFNNLTRLIAFIFTTMFVLNIGPNWIIGNTMIYSMLEGAETVFIWLGATVFILPLLMNYGLDEFLGVMLQPVMKPLFKVPGISSMTLVSSLFISPAVGIYVADEEYNKGCFSNKEAAITMTTLATIPIVALIILPVLMEIESEIPKLILVMFGTLFALGLIMPRIPPLSRENDHYLTNMKSVENVPKGIKAFNHALAKASTKAAETKFSLYESVMTIIELLMVIIPFILAWGAVSLIVFEYTQILQIISSPFNILLGLLGIEGDGLSPILLVGFIEPIIPVMIMKNITSIETKLILGALCLVQQVHLTEIGAMIFPSKVSIDFKKLFLIFILRTIIALPIIVFLTKLLI